jgi:hypothetical protein
MHILLNKDAVFCPHCKEDQDGIAEDFVIPGRIGAQSGAREKCIECQKPFYAERISESEIKISKL